MSSNIRFMYVALVNGNKCKWWHKFSVMLYVRFTFSLISVMPKSRQNNNNKLQPVHVRSQMKKKSVRKSGFLCFELFFKHSPNKIHHIVRTDWNRMKSSSKSVQYPIREWKSIWIEFNNRHTIEKKITLI